MTDLRVALVHPFAWPEVRRGGERYVEDLAVFLAGQGVAVDIVTGSSAGRDVEQRDDGVVVRRLRHVLGSRLRRWDVTPVETFGAAVWPTLARGRYDVVHAMTPTAAIGARLARRATVYTVLGHPTAAQLAHRVYDRRVFATAARWATVTAGLSRASADAIEELFGRRAEVLSPGVRIERFTPDLSARTGPPRLLFSAAAGDTRKGLDLALAAFARVLDAHPDARLWISGQGDAGWAFQSLHSRDRERVKGATDLLGPGSVDDVPVRYRRASLTVLPSVDEAFGIALVESLAAGTPVVCAASGGMPEIVGDAAVGRVAARTPEALGDAIEQTLRLAADAGTPTRCAIRARTWDWETSVGPAHLDLYQRILARSVSRTSRG